MVEKENESCSNVGEKSGDGECTDTVPGILPRVESPLHDDDKEDKEVRKLNISISTITPTTKTKKFP